MNADSSIEVQPSVGLVGSGSFGTAIMKLLCENLDQINWWVTSPYVKGYIKNEKRNPKYLTSVEFKPEQLNITTDINKLVKHSDIIFFLVPSIYLLDSLKNLEVSLKDKIVVTGIKGLIPQESKIIGDYFHDDLGIPYENIGVIAGPCHAEEIALERLSYLTVAFENEVRAEKVASLLRGKHLNTTLSNDILGTEHSAVLKNVYAISAGIAHGLGYGDNFIAVLLSNAIREMQDYLKVLSPLDRNINDSVYLGDLLVTGYSYFSRNRMFGNMIGKGYTVTSALMEMNMVPEGYYATDGIYKIAQENEIKLPILKTIFNILYGEKNPKKQFKKLSKKLN
ncbi:glycerol-3-phosphate dehydrogenase [Flavobacteriaceae bacterium Ap0902]|nr:glycerol-3-phosphate dehydrogenase [Flavobacteriaceae bacterium Ap0902]